MRHRTALTAACALLASGVAAAPATAATTSSTSAATTLAAPRTTEVACGAVLTSSVRLAADVTCPDGNGITLATDGIELNLNGHALVGPGASAADPAVGVRVAARNVVVRNGTVRGWAIGARSGFDPASEDEEPASSAVIRQTRLEGNDRGVDVRQEGTVSVRNSRFVGNATAGSSLSGGRLLVEGSTAEGNRGGFFSFDVGWNGLVLRDSTVLGSREAGVVCGQDGHVVVERSSLQRNQVAVSAFECSVRITDSALSWNGRHFQTYLVERDAVAVTCTRFTRDGGPLGFPTTPCGTGGRVSGTITETVPTDD